MNIVDSRDFEWLAWSYKNFLLQKQFKAREDAVLNMFDDIDSFELLPTPA